MILTRYDAAHPPAWANDPIEESAMIESRRPHIVRVGNGCVHVLRLHADAAGIWPLMYVVPKGTPFCHQCGCTDLFGCSPPCHWVNARQQLCSRCAERMVVR